MLALRLFFPLEILAHNGNISRWQTHFVILVLIKIWPFSKFSLLVLNKLFFLLFLFWLSYFFGVGMIKTTPLCSLDLDPQSLCVILCWSNYSILKIYQRDIIVDTPIRAWVTLELVRVIRWPYWLKNNWVASCSWKSYICNHHHIFLLDVAWLHNGRRVSSSNIIDMGFVRSILIGPR